MRISNEEGVYHRRLWVLFQYDYIEIEARTDHSEENPFYHYGDDFFFEGRIHFKKEFAWDRKYLYCEMIEFDEDAKRYKQYMNEKMKNVEVEIEFR